MQRYNKILNKLNSKNQLRTLPNIGNKKGVQIVFNGKEYINFSSNDYLGIASDIDLQQEFFNKINTENLSSEYGLSSSSSRLLTGNTHGYSLIENKLEQLYKKPALVFNSGYHTNIGILPALSSKNDLILSDKLNHASLVDGIKLSLAKTIRYKHLDYKQIEKILKNTRQNYDKVFLVSESVFSMDGDTADLDKLCYLRNKYNLILYIDEAHAVGTYGKQGLGMCQATNTLEHIDILVGTFGKAIASQGAFAICNGTIKNYLVNSCRSLIFTTALPPITLAWINFILNKLPLFETKRMHLKNLSEYAIKEFEKIGFKIPSKSNIIPLIVGENKKAEQMAESLQQQGFLLLPIRPPTVPKNTARLRLSLTANITFEQLNSLINLTDNCLISIEKQENND